MLKRILFIPVHDPIAVLVSADDLMTSNVTWKLKSLPKEKYFSKLAGSVYKLDSYKQIMFSSADYLLFLTSHTELTGHAFTIFFDSGFDKYLSPLLWQSITQIIFIYIPWKYFLNFVKSDDFFIFFHEFVISLIIMLVKGLFVTNCHFKVSIISVNS